VKKITENDEKPLSPDEQRRKNINDLFDLHIYFLEIRGLIEKNCSKKLKEEKFNIIKKIIDLLAEIDFSGKTWDIPFIICPQPEDAYCLIGISCDFTIGSKSTKEAHNSLAELNKHPLKDEELIILVKTFYPIMNGLKNEPPPLGEFRRNGTAYIKRIKI